MQQGSSQFGQNVVIAADAVIGSGVTIGNNVTIYPQVTVGDNCRIMDNAVIGRLTYPTRSVHRTYPTAHQPTLIGAGSVIGCNVVLYTGVRLGREVLLADGASIREGCVLADEVFLGRSVMLNYNTQIGRRTKIMDLTHITGNAFIGDDCFIGVLVGTANDNDVYLRRFHLHNIPQDVIGPRVGHYVVLANGVLLNPGVTIGDGALVGTGALVTRDIPPWAVALGAPATAKRFIDDDARLKILGLAQARGQQLADLPPVGPG
ncbi:MAG: acyltransferase [Chloroflexota bacterium]|nr:MAG: acyltransferase [Chloroflexota bacterium]